MSDSAKPAVVYLARNADGIAALRRFAESYRAHSSGLAHDLVVLYKGFRQIAELKEAENAFHGVEHRGIQLLDTGFDVGAYFECAKRIQNDYLVFLNTHSQIAACEWLTALWRYASKEGVGVAAAMGSFESLRDTVGILKDVIWRCMGVGKNYDQDLARYFDFLLRRHHRKWYSPTGAVIEPKHSKPGQSGRLALQATRILRYPWFALRGTALIWPGAPRFDVRQFPRFPNPHVRSNGFMIRRDRWLQLDFAPRQKIDTSLFESGPQSLTASLRKSGLATVVVGRDGRGYDIPEWPRSQTFRLGDQGNLLVHDNHTRAFETMSAGARVAHAWMTWGDCLGPLPPDFPDLGVALQADSPHRVSP